MGASLNNSELEAMMGDVNGTGGEFAGSVPGSGDEFKIMFEGRWVPVDRDGPRQNADQADQLLVHISNFVEHGDDSTAAFWSDVLEAISDRVVYFIHWALASACHCEDHGEGIKLVQAMLADMHKKGQVQDFLMTGQENENRAAAGENPLQADESALEELSNLAVGVAEFQDSLAHVVQSAHKGLITKDIRLELPISNRMRTNGIAIGCVVKPDGSTEAFCDLGDLDPDPEMKAMIDFLVESAGASIADFSKGVAAPSDPPGTSGSES